MIHTKLLGATAALAAIALMAGCAGVTRPVPPDSQKLAAFNRRPTVLYFVEGNGGFSTSPYRAFRDGMRDAGVTHEVRNFDWHFGLPYIVTFNLLQYEKVQVGAERLVREIVRMAEADPQRRIVLVGQSAGSEVILSALELLRPDIRIDTVLMLSPATSHDRPLLEPLRAIDGRLYVIHNPLEIGMLGLGTTLVGCTNRRHTWGAGYSGFDLPDPDTLTPDERAQYAKVHHAEWGEAMRAAGHSGTHFAGWSRTFVRNYVAHLIVDRPDREDLP